MLFVTGITGHSGSWLLKRLEKEKYEGRIRCVMRNSREEAPEKYKLFEECSLSVEFAVGDLNDETFVVQSMEGINTVIHISGIFLSKKILTAAIANQVSRLILVHTTGRFSKYKSASQGYIEIEDEILSKTVFNDQGERIINCTIVRPTMIYGSSRDHNMYRLVEYLARHHFFPLFGNGSNLIQPVHARDLGNAYYDILINPEKTNNKEYDLSGRYPMPYRDIIRIISSGLNRKTRVIKIPISLSILAARIYNTLFKNAIITVEQVMRMQEDKSFSHEVASKDFGYDPLSFEEGIHEEIREYLSGVRVDYSETRY